MKNILKFVFIASMFLFVYVTQIFAEEVVPKPEQAKAITLAEVNIKDARIISQKGNIFEISFSLVNGKGLQTGVKYGLKLIQKTEKGQYLLDEKIYEDSLTLNPNSKTNQSISYTAPDYLNGEYEIILSSKNSNNFPFATYVFRKVYLTSVSKGIIIHPETCYLKVEGEDSKLKYELTQGVDIKNDENIKLFCKVENLSNSEISANPSYETYIASSFGSKVESLSVSGEPITIGPLGSKEFSVNLPKASVPHSYSINFTLGNDSIKSNIINIFYVIRGSNAKISSLFLDKDYYNKGETALISFIYFPSIDVFINGRYPATSATNILSEVEIKDGNDTLCAEPEIKDLINQTSIKVEFPTPITSKCFNPKVLITLKDEGGNILDQQEFSIKTTSVSNSMFSKSNIIIFSIILLLIIIASYFYFKNKNTSQKGDIDKITDNKSSNINMFMLLFLFSSLLFVPTNSVKANTIYFEDMLKQGESYFVPNDVQNPSGPGKIYYYTTKIPVFLMYMVSDDGMLNYMFTGPNKNYSSPGSSIYFSSRLMCGPSYTANCSEYYQLYLNVDVLENYNNNLLGKNFTSQSVRDLWNWFNGGVALRLTASGASYLDIEKTIPVNFSFGLQEKIDKIHFLWFITKQETPTTTIIEWQSDNTISVNPNGSENTNVAGNYPNLPEADTINMYYPPEPVIPEPTVDVVVNNEQGPIILNTGSNVEVRWDSSLNLTWCNCVCRDPITNSAINCGSTLSSSCSGVNTLDNNKKYVGIAIKSNPHPIPNVIKPTKFDVHCE